RGFSDAQVARSTFPLTRGVIRELRADLAARRRERRACASDQPAVIQRAAAILDAVPAPLLADWLLCARPEYAREMTSGVALLSLVVVPYGTVREHPYDVLCK